MLLAFNDRSICCIHRFVWNKYLSFSLKKLKKERPGWDLKGGRKSVLSWTAFLAKQQILLFSLGNSRSPLNAMQIGLTIAEQSKKWALPTKRFYGKMWMQINKNVQWACFLAVKMLCVWTVWLYCSGCRKAWDWGAFQNEVRQRRLVDQTHPI